ncbi:MAG: AAA family ATPase [Planctomycetota bacterium]
MAYTIALSGKGGTGKTTVAAMLVSILLENKCSSVLAVDADPNYNLGLALGVNVQRTIADVREELMEQKLSLPQEMSKERIVEYEIQKALEERKGFSLLTMGRPEGPGCYCYINTILRKYLDIVSSDYSYVIIDNEAGMEHLSRRTTKNIDHLIVTTLPDTASILAAERIAEITNSLPINVHKTSIIFNRIREYVPIHFAKKLEESSLPVLVSIPHDNKLEEYISAGKSLISIASQTETYMLLSSVKDKILSTSDNKTNNVEKQCSA